MDRVCVVCCPWEEKMDCGDGELGAVPGSDSPSSMPVY